MDGLNNLLSKKLGIALTAIFIIGKAGASPTATIICQAVIAIVAMIEQFLLDKEKKDVQKIDDVDVPD